MTRNHQVLKASIQSDAHLGKHIYHLWDCGTCNLKRMLQCDQCRGNDVIRWRLTDAQLINTAQLLAIIGTQRTENSILCACLINSDCEKTCKPNDQAIRKWRGNVFNRDGGQLILFPNIKLKQEKLNLYQVNVLINLSSLFYYVLKFKWDKIKKSWNIYDSFNVSLH